MDNGSSSLADVLERVLDKGVVIVGDIAVNVMDIELLTLRLRLFIASAQTAREMGMDWWTGDPFFAPHAAIKNGEETRDALLQQNAELRDRLAVLEKAVLANAVLENAVLDNAVLENAAGELQPGTRKAIP